MEAAEISKMIEQEINGHWSLTNAHAISLEKCLIPPVRRIYENSGQKGETVELWLVLEEIQEDRSGYKIVFDENRRMFGLAICGAGEYDVLLAYYGTFLETVKAM